MKGNGLTRLTRSLITAGEIGAWVCLLYVYPVFLYFLVRGEPSSLADTLTGHVAPVQICEFLLPYYGLRYVTWFEWFLYHSAIVAGLAGHPLWYISLIIRWGRRIVAVARRHK